MNSIAKLTALSVAILVGGLSLSAAAQGGRANFETLDTNSDGQITRAELEARGADRFAAADTNGDGALSLAELETAQATQAKDRAARMLSRLDANEDGQLSQDELGKMRKRGGRMFERADADSDGVITKAEFDAMKAKHGKRHNK